MAEDAKSDSEVRLERINVLGPELGPVFHELDRELLWVQVKWEEYKALFATSPESVDVLNTLAPFFWWNIQTVMWEDVLLHICRLTDPPKRRLTVKQLPNLCPDDERVREELEKRIADAVHATRFARDWRNRRIAHRDLETALGQRKGNQGRAKPLAPATRLDVEQALRSTNAVLNVIRRRLLGEGTVLGDEIVVGGPPTGAEAFVAEIQALVDLGRRFAGSVGMTGNEGDVDSAREAIAKLGHGEVEQYEAALTLQEFVQRFSMEAEPKWPA